MPFLTSFITIISCESAGRNRGAIRILSEGLLDFSALPASSSDGLPFRKRDSNYLRGSGKE